jgi:hypothetical protein|eukprot:COSAG02_NODE_15934_length_1128_cov_1.051506_2_plen_53_part_00
MEFICLDQGGCAAPFPDAVIKKALPKRVYAGLQARIQQAELRAAGLTDLVRA